MTGLGVNLVGPTYTSVTRGVTIGTDGSGITLLDLQASTNTTAETSGDCATTINPGGIYYSAATATNNTTTQDLRGCINGNWQDIVTADQLGLMLLGVVENSGSNPGDLGGITGMANGPCKVSWATSTSVSVAPCIAYSGGRKVVVSSAVTISSLNGTNKWYHICLNGTNGSPTATAANSSQTAGVPAFSATSPVLCIADIKTSGSSVISNIYDTRTFVSSTKEFVSFTSGSQTGVAPGMIVIGNTLTYNEVTTTNGAGSVPVRGVVAVGSPSNDGGNSVNAIITTAGPAFVDGDGAGGSLDDGAETSSVAAGYARSWDQGTSYVHGIYLGTIEQIGSSSACNASTNCQFSFLVDVDLN